MGDVQLTHSGAGVAARKDRVDGLAEGGEDGSFLLDGVLVGDEGVEALGCDLAVDVGHGVGGSHVFVDFVGVGFSDCGVVERKKEGWEL